MLLGCVAERSTARRMSGRIKGYRIVYRRSVNCFGTLDEPALNFDDRIELDRNMHAFAPDVIPLREFPRRYYLRTETGPSGSRARVRATDRGQ